MRHKAIPASNDVGLLAPDGVVDGHVGDVKLKGSEAIAHIVGHQGFKVAINHTVGQESTTVAFIISSTEDTPISFDTRRRILQALSHTTGAVFSDETGDGPEKIFARFTHITKP